MKFSIRTTLLAVGCLAILSWRAAPYVDEYFRTYELIEGSDNAMHFRGSSNAMAAFALRSSGNPTFIANYAQSDVIPFLDGSNLPYLLVVQHMPNADFEFDSFHTDEFNQTDLPPLDSNDLWERLQTSSKTISIESKLKIGSGEFCVNYLIDDGSSVEQLTIDDNEFDLRDGRVVTMVVDREGKLSLHQHKFNTLKIEEIAGPETRTDSREFVRPVLKWWSRFQKWKSGE